MVTNIPNGYKKTIAGVIPEHWDAKLIKNFANVVRGGSPRPAGSSLYFNGDFIPWITVADVTRNSDMHLRKTKTMLTEAGSKRTRIIEPDTLLLTNSGATLGVPKISLIRAGANDGIAMILDPKGVLKEYLYYFLSSKTQYFRERLAPGLGQPNLNTDIIGTVAVPIPPIEEQKEIIRVFEEQNVLIEKTEALIRAKQQQFSWLRANIIRSAKNTTPAHFGDFLTESRIPNTLDDARKRLTVRLHLKGVDIRDYRGTESDGATQYFVRKAGQLVYGKQNIFRGSIGIIPKELDGYSSSQDIPAFDIADNVDAEWLFWYMSRPSFYEKLEHFSSGSGSKRLHPKELFKMPIKLPPLPEQQHIAHTLNTAQAEIRLLQQLAEKYRTQKRGLMQKLLTGEWRVGSDKEAAA